MLRDKNLNPMVTQLFVRVRNSTFHLLLSRNHILLCQKNIRINSRGYLILKIPNKRKLQQIVFHQIRTLKALLTFTKNLLKNHFFFSY